MSLIGTLMRIEEIFQISWDWFLLRRRRRLLINLYKRRLRRINKKRFN
jgi:hypothetical protein